MSKFSVKFFFCLYFWQFQLTCMIADVKLALQKDGFILLPSIRPSVRMSAHTYINILCQSFVWSFFLLLIFLKAFYLGCWCLINVTSVWLQNSWHHSAANLRSRSQTEISVENKSESLWPIFHGSGILPYILKTVWCLNMMLWGNESVWLDAWPQNKSGSLWPIFHGSVILPYILKTIWCINIIPWNNESVWLGAWPQNKSGPGSLWAIFHGSVILPHALKTIWYINIILWGNESVWLDA